MQRLLQERMVTALFNRCCVVINFQLFFGGVSVFAQQAASPLGFLFPLYYHELTSTNGVQPRSGDILGIKIPFLDVSLNLSPVKKVKKGKEKVPKTIVIYEDDYDDSGRSYWRESGHRPRDKDRRRRRKGNGRYIHVGKTRRPYDRKNRRRHYTRQGSDKDRNEDMEGKVINGKVDKEKKDVNTTKDEVSKGINGEKLPKEKPLHGKKHANTSLDIVAEKSNMKPKNVSRDETSPGKKHANKSLDNVDEHSNMKPKNVSRDETSPGKKHADKSLHNVDEKTNMKPKNVSRDETSPGKKHADKSLYNVDEKTNMKPKNVSRDEISLRKPQNIYNIDTVHSNYDPNYIYKSNISTENLPKDSLADTDLKRNETKLAEVKEQGTDIKETSQPPQNIGNHKADEKTESESNVSKSIDGISENDDLEHIWYQPQNVTIHVYEPQENNDSKGIDGEKKMVGGEKQDVINYNNYITIINTDGKSKAGNNSSEGNGTQDDLHKQLSDDTAKQGINRDKINSGSGANGDTNLKGTWIDNKDIEQLEREYENEAGKKNVSAAERVWNMEQHGREYEKEEPKKNVSTAEEVWKVLTESPSYRLEKTQNSDIAKANSMNVNQSQQKNLADNKTTTQNVSANGKEFRDLNKNEHEKDSAGKGSDDKQNGKNTSHRENLSANKKTTPKKASEQEKEGVKSITEVTPHNVKVSNDKLTGDGKIEVGLNTFFTQAMEEFTTNLKEEISSTDGEEITILENED